MRLPDCTKKSFLLTISLVNVTKSTVSRRFGHILLKKYLMENLIFCVVVVSEVYLKSYQTSTMERFTKIFKN